MEQELHAQLLSLKHQQQMQQQMLVEQFHQQQMQMAKEHEKQMQDHIKVSTVPPGGQIEIGNPWWFFFLLIKKKKIQKGHLSIGMLHIMWLEILINVFLFISNVRLFEHFQFKTLVLVLTPTTLEHDRPSFECTEYFQWYITTWVEECVIKTYQPLNN